MDIRSLTGRKVTHKTFGEGIVRKTKGHEITVEFAEKTTTFRIPDAFERGFLSFADGARIRISSTAGEKPGQTKATSAIVFLNIGWMEGYCGEEDDHIDHGGSFVDETGTGNEDCNFCPFSYLPEGDEKWQTVMLGSFETKTGNGERANQTHIERIRGCGAMGREPSVDGVTVVWCATAPQGGSCVVGWYKNATVFRDYQELEMDAESDEETWWRTYNVMCQYEDAVLLPPEVRKKPEWSVPRHKQNSNTPYGFGQANIWYASEAAADEYVERILKQIREYQGEDYKPKLVDKE